MNLKPFNGTFGLPPSTHVSDEMIFNSMPVFEITPCRPNFQSGLNLFSVEQDVNTYSKILGNHGFTTEVPIKLAFIADNFPTDSFVNDYGETFLQKFTDVASQGMGQLAQMAGAESGTQAAKLYGQKLIAADESVQGFVGDMMGAIGKTAVAGATGIEQAVQSDAIRSLVGGGGQVLNKMIAGHRVDFPQVWRNSSYTPSYTATVRLYNPNPGSDASTRQYIIGPLAAILCLSLPRTDDGSTFNWPFFHKIKAKGIYNLNPSVITNITVVKGGDQQQIAFNQRLGIVDVRIDFTSLFNSILLEESGNLSRNRPTLRSYLSALESYDTHYKRGKLQKNAGNMAGANTSPYIASADTDEEKAVKLKQEAISRREGGGSSATDASQSRALSFQTTQTGSLIDQSPDGLIKPG